MTPADLRSLAYAMRTNPTAYASSNDNLAAFCYGVLVGAGDDRVRDAWRAAVAHVFHPDDHGSMEPEWSTHPTLRIVDVFEHAAFSLDLTTEAPDESPIVDLILRAQTEADPDRHCHALARRGYPLLADVAKRSREALDAATKPVAMTSPTRDEIIRHEERDGASEWLHRCGKHSRIVHVAVSEVGAIDTETGALLCERGHWWPLRNGGDLGVFDRAQLAANTTPAAPPFAFDDPPPAVARREAFARAWRLLDAGDERGCIREMLTMMERA